MNAERLLAIYDRVADAPDAVPSLRRFVLDLAVRGKLVEQDPNDEPASELLKRIEEEKIRLVKARMARKGKKLPPAEDSPTQLPNAWCWTEIAEVGWISPRNDFPDDHIASFVPMRLIPTEYGTFKSHEMRQWGDIKKGYTHFAEGDVGLAKITPCFENGKSVVFRNLAGGIGSGTTELHVVRPIFVDADYIVIFLKSPLFIENGILRMTGTAGQKRVSREYFANSPFPLPPLTEQRRIVSKVDELMALCDQLERTRNEREQTRDRLTKASYARLAASNADETFQVSARLVTNAFPMLTARADQIKQLRQTILDLAVRGKLVEQDPNDEPASELLRQIEAEKVRLKINDSSKPLTSDEIPFALPMGWDWSRIGQICTKTGSGSTPRGGKSVYRNSGVLFLRSQNVYNEGLRLDEVAYIDPVVHARMAGTTVHPRDLLLNITGGSMGRCAHVPGDFSEGNISQHVAIIRPALSEIADFLHKFILSPSFQKFIFSKQTGAGRGGLPKNRMDQIPVAVPPLSEQRRIVSRVDELMLLCDQLEANLNAADNGRTDLLKSLLREALKPAGNEQDVVRLNTLLTGNDLYQAHEKTTSTRHTLRENTSSCT